jgi:hypothetical protein
MGRYATRFSNSDSIFCPADIPPPVIRPLEVATASLDHGRCADPGRVFSVRTARDAPAALNWGRLALFAGRDYVLHSGAVVRGAQPNTRRNLGLGVEAAAIILTSAHTTRVPFNNSALRPDSLHPRQLDQHGKDA